jgi:hypothetical protein
MARWIAVCLVLLMGCASSGPSITDQTSEDQGPDYGNVLLPAPGSEKSAEYLGLKDATESFRILQVQAGVLVVEIFDMYCIYCQRAAPEVNRFYRTVQRAGLGDRIKLVGVGRKNSEVEVEVFRDRYEVEFPLFQDPTLSLTEALGAGKEGTPHFLVLDLQDGAGTVMVDSNKGSFGDPEKFLERIRKHLKEKEE